MSQVLKNCSTCRHRGRASRLTDSGEQLYICGAVSSREPGQNYPFRTQDASAIVSGPQLSDYNILEVTDNFGCTLHEELGPVLVETEADTYRVASAEKNYGIIYPYPIKVIGGYKAFSVITADLAYHATVTEAKAWLIDQSKED